MDFSTARLLQYSHQKEFFGQNLFYFKTTKNLTIQGTFWQYNRQSGVSGIYEDINSFLSQSHDYQPITIGGITFGTGRINNINFEEGTDVQIKNWTADIVCYDTGNLFNFTGGNYNGINTSNFSALDRLDESFNFNQDQANKNTYSHTVNIRFNSGIGLQPISLAKTLAASLMSINSITGFLGNYSGTEKKTYQERYNLQTNECSFTENVEYDQKSGSNYSITYTNEIRTDQGGITTVSENGIIKGLYQPLSGSVISGFDAEQANFFTRCSGIFSTYGPGSGYVLFNYPIEKKVDFDHFRGILQYNYTFSNNPALKTSGIWEYEHNLDRDISNIYRVNERGSVKGIGRSRSDKFNAAINQFNAISGTILTRTSGVYNTLTSGTLPLFLIRQSYGRNEAGGEINYETNYTDDVSLVSNSRIRKQEITYTDNLFTPLVNRFDIVNVKELVQNVSGIPNLASRNFNLKLIGARAVTLQEYIASGKNIAASYVPSSGVFGQDIWLNDLSYSYDSGNNNFTLNADWLATSGGSTFHDIVSTVNL
ncbi:MAG: hypothetical protein AABY22_08345 [Nanoarchaeota archaeon]